MKPKTKPTIEDDRWATAQLVERRLGRAEALLALEGLVHYRVVWGGWWQGRPGRRRRLYLMARLSLEGVQKGRGWVVAWKGTLQEQDQATTRLLLNMISHETLTEKRYLALKPGDHLYAVAFAENG